MRLLDGNALGNKMLEGLKRRGTDSQGKEREKRTLHLDTKLEEVKRLSEENAQTMEKMSEENAQAMNTLCVKNAQALEKVSQENVQALEKMEKLGLGMDRLGIGNDEALGKMNQLGESLARLEEDMRKLPESFPKPEPIEIPAPVVEQVDTSELLERLDVINYRVANMSTEEVTEEIHKLNDTMEAQKAWLESRIAEQQTEILNGQERMAVTQNQIIENQEQIAQGYQTMQSERLQEMEGMQESINYMNQNITSIKGILEPYADVKGLLKKFGNTYNMSKIVEASVRLENARVIQAIDDANTGTEEKTKKEMSSLRLVVGINIVLTIATLATAILSILSNL